MVRSRLGELNLKDRRYCKESGEWRHLAFEWFWEERGCLGGSGDSSLAVEWRWEEGSCLDKGDVDGSAGCLGGVTVHLEEVGVAAGKKRIGLS